MISVIKDIKLNDENIKNLETLSDKMKFTDNSLAIENHLKLYE